MDDVAQDVLALFLENTDVAKTDVEFEAWAYKAALTLTSKERYRKRNELSEDSLYTDGYADLSDDRNSFLDHLMVEHGRIGRPGQLIRCDLMDALTMIKMLPTEFQTLLMDIIRSEDVVGYAEDHGVSLFEAMSRLKHARIIMNRLAEDMADERKETAYGLAPLKA